MRLRALVLSLALVPGIAAAQDDQTLADIRQSLSVLSVDLQRLQRELSTTGGVGTSIQGTSVLERVDAMEAELRRLTAETERLQNRISRVVSDGTNRIGDLTFRLCEIEEGCDIGAIGETPPLGGDEAAPPPPAQPDPVTDGAQLALGEQADFDRAKEALDSGSFRSAIDLFAAFTETYTGGPLTGEAHYLRAKAFEQLGETQSAARAYLEAFSGQPTGPRAGDALVALGLSLDTLGQRADACVTLGEAITRFPDSTAAAEAQAARASLSCP
ncbi:tol-pal system protein YbgF [Palleronia sediminis]|uniref:Cell division coordinator CpoB n=1 Tax=Palleronia sediminis TaxID=2547833 RepID=A0A4R6A197_9RHOB|nr:tol-pal system protein YbgF [Palleronia sediminis]TDL76334.1 tol-pal system protein YbgF [Palleronia sediminis]